MKWSKWSGNQCWNVSLKIACRISIEFSPIVVVCQTLPLLYSSSRIQEYSWLALVEQFYWPDVYLILARIVVHSVYEPSQICVLFWPDVQRFVCVSSNTQLEITVIVSASELQLNHLPVTHHFPHVLTHQHPHWKVFVRHHIVAHTFFINKLVRPERLLLIFLVNFSFDFVHLLQSKVQTLFIKCIVTDWTLFKDQFRSVSHFLYSNRIHQLFCVCINFLFSHSGEILCEWWCYARCPGRLILFIVFWFFLQNYLIAPWIDWLPEDFEGFIVFVDFGRTGISFFSRLGFGETIIQKTLVFGFLFKFL